ncbi:MAG: CBS domain-containing protein [Bdellovibrionaceae bacterium]|nr:CBS domain-containing protein [Pseudobdellovibrionaceae bacterium]
MKIRDIMTRAIHMVRATQTLQEAARIMREQDVGMLPVLNGSDVVGILTDRDIVLNAVANGLNPQRTSISDAMSRNVITVHETDTLDTAAHLMKNHRIRRLIVIDKEKHPIGVISLGDLATRAGAPELTERIVEVVSEDRSQLHH